LNTITSLNSYKNNCSKHSTAKKSGSLVLKGLKKFSFVYLKIVSLIVPSTPSGLFINGKSFTDREFALANWNDIVRNMVTIRGVACFCTHVVFDALAMRRDI